MKLEQVLILAILCCLSIFMLVYYYRQEHPVKSALFGSLSGLSGFFAAKLIFFAAGVVLPLNLFSLLFSAVLGLPGVVALSILQIAAC